MRAISMISLIPKNTPQMRNALILILASMSISVFSQYSSYYGRYDVNVKSDIDVTGNVNVNKTIKTIDYGALALANAEREKARLEAIKYADQAERHQAIEIASDPIKAFDYGRDNNWEATGKAAQKFGFKRFTWYHKIPHKSLFVKLEGYNYQNISPENVVTELILSGAFNVEGMKDEAKKAQYKEDFELLINDPEAYAKLPEFTVGEFNQEINAFIHSKDINKAKVFGVNGYKGTVIYEDDYEYVIKDNYYASINGVFMQAGVRYKGDKDEITFEDLEGRRYYLRRLCEQIISTSSFTNVK